MIFLWEQKTHTMSTWDLEMINYAIFLKPTKYFKKNYFFALSNLSQAESSKKFEIQLPSNLLIPKRIVREWLKNQSYDWYFGQLLDWTN